MSRVNEQCSYELDCRYDSRASFYGKATVYEYEDGTSLLKSYSTIVAGIYRDENGEKQAYFNGQYSQTTTRHQKEYFKQHGFHADSVRQMEKDYGSPENFNWEDFKLERGQR